MNLIQSAFRPASPPSDEFAEPQGGVESAGKQTGTTGNPQSASVQARGVSLTQERSACTASHAPADLIREARDRSAA
jgi:hypothetical protein